MRYYYSYTEYLSDCKQLTVQIDGEFDAIIAIARGGITLAHMLGEHYDIREVYTINTIGYDDTEKLDCVEVFNIPDLKEAKNILVVDDIVDSGDTMRLVLQLLSDHYPKCSFRSAALFYKKTAIIKPDWHVRYAEEWIDFFWSVDMVPE